MTATENFEATKELLELTRYDDLRWIVCVKVATLNFHAFFVYGIVLQKSSTGSNGNGQNATFLKMVS